MNYLSLKLNFGRKSHELNDMTAYDYLKYDLGYSEQKLRFFLNDLRREMGGSKTLSYYLPMLGKRFGFLDKNPISPYKMRFFNTSLSQKVKILWRK